MSENKTKGTNIWKTLIIAVAVITGLGILSIVAIIVSIIIFKPFDFSLENISDVIETQITSDITESSYDHPLLSEDQEILLESVGVKTSELPTELSQEQIDCGIEALGQERTNEIMAGDTPGFSDLLKAQHCF